MADTYWPVILALSAQLEAAGIPHDFVGNTGLFIQEVAVPDLTEVEVAVQWDYFETARTLLSADDAGEEIRNRDRAWFTCALVGVPVRVACVYNSVIETDPHRVRVERDGKSLWAKSLLWYRTALGPGDPRLDWIGARLAELQAWLSRHNQEAWSQNTSDAWVLRHGEPEQAAARIQADPAARLAPLGRHLSPLAGRKVANLLGSHGSKAVAMALLGAQVTVVDISSENQQYALRLAASAGVPLRYLVSDVLALPDAELTGDYHLVVMELGVLHYFVDLAPLAVVIARLLAPGGRLVLHDFHPVSTKLITARGKKQKVTGNYFDPSLIPTDVAYTKYLPDDRPGALKQALLRKWTLGEIVTAVAEAGLCLERLEEEPNTKLDDMGIPKTFTLIARRLPV